MTSAVIPSGESDSADSGVSVKAGSNFSRPQLIVPTRAVYSLSGAFTPSYDSTLNVEVVSGPFTTHADGFLMKPVVSPAPFLLPNRTRRDSIRPGVMFLMR